MKPHRLAWFQKNIGKTIRRRDIFTCIPLEIYIEDNKQAQRLFYTQFDLHFTYFK
jgi:hypothetical protein